MLFDFTQPLFEEYLKCPVVRASFTFLLKYHIGGSAEWPLLL